MLCVFVFMLLCGCSAAPAETEKPAFEKTGMNAGLGGSDDLSQSDYSYTVYLAADESLTPQISSMRVTVGDSICDRVIAQEEPKFLCDADTITVEGKISFASNGLTKAQIENLVPFMKSLEVTMKDGTVYSIPLSSESFRTHREGGGQIVDNPLLCHAEEPGDVTKK